MDEGWLVKVGTGVTVSASVDTTCGVDPLILNAVSVAATQVAATSGVWVADG